MYLDPTVALCRLNCCSMVLAEIMSKLMPFCLMIFLYNLWGFTGIGPIDLLFHLNDTSPFVLIKHIGCGDGQSQISLSVLPVVCVCTLHFVHSRRAGQGLGLSHQPLHIQHLKSENAWERNTCGMNECTHSLSHFILTQILQL